MSEQFEFDYNEQAGTPDAAEEMPPLPERVEVVGIRFKTGGKVYFFDPCGLELERGQDVIIDTARGTEFGSCAEPNHVVASSCVVQPLRRVIRVATAQDIQTVEDNKKKEERAFEVCQQKILEYDMDMKLVEVEYSFDGSKILFFFTSDGRVDFRELVKNLASVFRTRIELRQIGVRDEAKMLGGLGICGKPFCCSTFLDDFQPVSIKMAKTQNLSLNPTKISGTCGRLMCCLKYEQDAYEDMIKSMPKNESYVDTPDGRGTVNEVNLLKNQVKVRLDNDHENPRYYCANALNILRNGKAPKGSKSPEYPDKEEPAPLQEYQALNEKEFLSQMESEKPKNNSPRPQRPAKMERMDSDAAHAGQPDKSGNPAAQSRSLRQSQPQRHQNHPAQQDLPPRQEHPAEGQEAQDDSPKRSRRRKPNEKKGGVKVLSQSAAAEIPAAAEKPEKSNQSKNRTRNSRRRSKSPAGETGGNEQK